MKADGYRFSLEPVDVPKVETKHRRIVTPIPVPESLEILDRISRYESSIVMDQLPVFWDRAEGHHIQSSHGTGNRVSEKIIDMVPCAEAVRSCVSRNYASEY